MLTIFSKNKRRSREDNFFLKLYNVEIPKDPNPTFLGVKFDPHLTFSQHANLIVEKSRTRLGVIKILSHYNTWKLNQKTLVKVYVSLIRSLFEYTGFAFHLFSEGIKKDLRAIFIFAKSRKFFLNQIC